LIDGKLGSELHNIEFNEKKNENINMYKNQFLRRRSADFWTQKHQKNSRETLKNNIFLIIKKPPYLFINQFIPTLFFSNLNLKTKKKNSKINRMPKKNCKFFIDQNIFRETLCKF